MKKVLRYIWSVKHIILAVLSVIFVSAAAYAQNSATDLINEGTLKVPYTLSDGTVPVSYTHLTLPTSDLV